MLAPNAGCSGAVALRTCCGTKLEQLDVLVLNHGINPQGDQTPDQLTTSLEVNALSTWRLIRAFEACGPKPNASQPREIWVNTSEAEIQPAISPGYEISKRLIGQLVSIHGAVRSAEAERHSGFGNWCLARFAPNSIQSG